jgi:hypothetical protein
VGAPRAVTARDAAKQNPMRWDRAELSNYTAQRHPLKMVADDFGYTVSQILLA